MKKIPKFRIEEDVLHEQISENKRFNRDYMIYD